MGLFLDLMKGFSTRALDRSKLIQKEVLVKRADGKTFTRKQWCLPDGTPVSYRLDSDTDVDHDVTRFKRMSEKDKAEVMKDFISKNRDLAENIHDAMAHQNPPMNMRDKKAPLSIDEEKWFTGGLASKFINNIDSFPIDHIRDKLQKEHEKSLKERKKVLYKDDDDIMFDGDDDSYTRTQMLDEHGTPLVEHSRDRSSDKEYSDFTKLKLRRKKNVLSKFCVENPELSRKVCEAVEAFIEHEPDYTINKAIQDKFKGKTPVDLAGYLLTRSLESSQYSTGKEQFPVPMEYLKDYIAEQLDTDKPASKTGLYEGLNLENLTSGIPFEQEFYSDILDASEQYGMSTADVLKDIKNIFKDVTPKGLRSVINPDPKNLSCSVDEMLILGEKDVDSLDVQDDDIIKTFSGAKNTKVKFSFTLTDRDSGEKVASIERAYRKCKESNNLIVDHDFLSINEDYQNKGYGSKLYGKSDSLYRYLADDTKPILITTFANIDIGSYAWAGKGFEFATDAVAEITRDKLQRYCSRNDIDLDAALQHSGIDSIEDMTSTAHFYCLDDGKRYFLPDYPVSGGKDRYEPLPINVHLGKLFLLHGVRGWDGYKALNCDHHTEELSKLYEQRKSKS